MHRWLASGCLILVLACSEQPAITAQRPTSNPTSTRPSTSIPAADLSCRLPVARDGTRTHGGFITFPGGTFTEDPRAPAWPTYYDRVVSAWLSVPRTAVSPDGTHYARIVRGNLPSPAQPATLQMIAVAGGSDQVITLPIDFPAVLDYGADGVYLTSSYEGTGGLWKVDFSGSVTELSDLYRVEAVAGGGLWYGAVDPADPLPLTGLEPQPDTLLRLDLRTHTTERWFYRPTTSAYVMGFDRDGGVVVRVEKASATDTTVIASEIWLISSPGKEVLISSIPGDRQWPGQLTIADENGLWFGGVDGIFLYTPAGGVRKMSDFTGYPANGCR